jgi:hypothetical protein
MTSIYGTKSLKKVALAAALAVSAGSVALAADMPIKAPPKVKEVPFFFVNDTSISGTYFFRATDPGVSCCISTANPGGVGDTKNTMYRAQGSVDHFDVWEYGTNLIHIEADQYGKSDPILGEPGAVGSREFFSFAQSTFGFNELSHSKAFSNPITKDVSFMFRVTAGVQDNYLSEQTTQYAPGLWFDLNLPGTVGVGITAYKEFTHNEFNACGPAGFGNAQSPAAGLGGGLCGAPALGGSFSGDRDFEWTWKLFYLVTEPLTFLPPSLPVTFVAFGSVTGPKGTGISTANCLAVGCFGALGAFNSNESKTESFNNVQLVFDASKVFWGKPGIWDTYVGYRYWMDKFGTNKNAALFAGCTTCNGGGPGGAPGTSVESTVYLGSTYHFK